VALIERRTGGVRGLDDFGGLRKIAPVFTGFMGITLFASLGLPGLNGFVGEFLVIMGTMKVNFWYAAIAATTLLFGAAYTLWMYKRVVFGAVTNSHVEALTDIDAREGLVLALVAIAVLGMGLYPQAFASVLHNSVGDVLALAMKSKL